MNTEERSYQPCHAPKVLTQPSISKSEDKEKLVIEITDNDGDEWVEKIGKTAYEIRNDPARNRIKLNDQHTGFIMESNMPWYWVQTYYQPG